MSQTTRVLLVGETWTVLKLHIKGFDLFPLGGFENFGVWFMEAMAKFDDIQAEHMPNHIALTSFPSLSPIFTPPASVLCSIFSETIFITTGNPIVLAACTASAPVRANRVGNT